MKKSRKILLIIILLVLLVCLPVLIWLVSRPDESVAARVSKSSGRPAFEVNVEKPRMDRLFAGILPTMIETKLVGELRFDHASSGARIGNVGQGRIELTADGWDLLIETDGKGGIVQGTRLVFPIEIAEKKWTLRCRPADRAVGYLDATTRPSMSNAKSSEVRDSGSGEIASDVLDGRFLVELARCEDAATGEILDTEAGANPGDAWPEAPLTLRGSFAGLPLAPP